MPQHEMCHHLLLVKAIAHDIAAAEDALWLSTDPLVWVLLLAVLLDLLVGDVAL